MTKRAKWTPEALAEAERRGIGLGDLVAGAAKWLGLKECEGCRKRRAKLNKVRIPWRRKSKG